MRIFRPLRHRAIVLVWGSQILSNIGDEMNRVAATWLGTQLWGTKAAYLVALTSACTLAASVMGARWAEQFHPRRLMILADILRGTAMLCLPLGLALTLPLGPLLIGVTAVAAVFSAFFEPALRSALPSLAKDPALLSPTNALIESSARFARVMGPGVVGLVSGLLPVIHLFTLDALTFAFSALALGGVPKDRLGSVEATPSTSGGSLRQTVQVLRTEQPIWYALWSAAPVASAWNFFLPLGMGLKVQSLMPDNVRALAWLIAAYGAGNLASNLALGNYTGRADRLMFGGRVVAGLGFFGVATASDLWTMMPFAALAAMGGPATDLGFIGMLQARFTQAEIARIWRVVLAVCHSGMLVFFFTAPLWVERLGLVPVLVGASLIVLAAGLYGFARYAPKTPALKAVTPDVRS